MTLFGSFGSECRPEGKSDSGALATRKGPALAVARTSTLRNSGFLHTGLHALKRFLHLFAGMWAELAARVVFHLGEYRGIVRFGEGVHDRDA